MTRTSISPPRLRRAHRRAFVLVIIVTLVVLVGWFDGRLRQELAASTIGALIAAPPTRTVD